MSDEKIPSNTTSSIEVDTSHFTKDQIELEIRRLLSTEATAHRNYLEQLLAQVKWGVGIIVVTGATLFAFFIGKSFIELSQVSTNIKAQAETMVADRIVDLKVQESINHKIESVTDAIISANSLSDRISKVVSNKADNAVEVAFQQRMAMVIDEKLNKVLGQTVQSGFSVLPIGTVVASMLAPPNFAKLVGDPNPFNAGLSKWKLADGDSVEGSSYARITSLSIVPNMRGMFLRGVNAGRDDGRQDPETRDAGSYEEDMFKQHDHGGGDHTHTTLEQNGAAQGFGQIIVRKTGPILPSDTQQPVSSSGKIIKPEGGPETRPKNIAVYYYIRIN